MGRCPSRSARPSSFRFWLVNAGVKGIRILAPIVGVRRKRDTEVEKDITKQNERMLLGFRNAYLFDISQTNGVELPEMEHVAGDPDENIERLTAFLNSKGIAVSYSDKIAPALGMSYGGRIALLTGQSKAETFSTLSMRQDTNSCTAANAARQRRRPCARPRPRLWRLLSGRLWG